MKERPILFSTAMVEAIMRGEKRETRRVVKLVGNDNNLPLLGGRGKTHVLDAPERGLCPYGQPGDELYVRETWGIAEYPGGVLGVNFKARPPIMLPLVPAEHREWAEGKTGRWRSSIHMPKWMARTWLKVEHVKVQLLQDITDHEAKREGVNQSPVEHITDPAHTWKNTDSIYRWRFRHLWDSLNAERGYGWDENPWVWVVRFHVIEGKGLDPRHGIL